MRATSKVTTSKDIWDFDEESDEDEDEDENLRAQEVGKSNAVSSDNRETKFDNCTAFTYMFYYAHRFICKRSNESITK